VYDASYNGLNFLCFTVLYIIVRDKLCSWCTCVMLGGQKVSVHLMITVKKHAYIF
jgi:hypothetical protein